MPKQIKIPTKEQLEELYIKKELSYDKIADLLKLGKTTIARLINKNKIIPRKNRTEKQNKEIAKRLKGRKITWVNKIREFRKGKTWEDLLGKEKAEIQRELFRRKFSGRGNPMYGKRGRNNPNYGKKYPLAGQKIREKKLKEWQDPKNKYNSQEYRNKRKIIITNFFNEHPEKHPNRVLAKMGKLSKPQLKMFETLKEKYSDAQLNYPIKVNGTTFFADVGILSLKIDYEYDEPYFHQNKEKDDRRDTLLKEIGWKIIRINNIKDFKLV